MGLGVNKINLNFAEYCSQHKKEIVGSILAMSAIALGVVALIAVSFPFHIPVGSGMIGLGVAIPVGIAIRNCIRNRKEYTQAKKQFEKDIDRFEYRIHGFEGKLRDLVAQQKNKKLFFEHLSQNFPISIKQQAQEKIRNGKDPEVWWIAPVSFSRAKEKDAKTEAIFEIYVNKGRITSIEVKLGLQFLNMNAEDSEAATDGVVFVTGTFDMQKREESFNYSDTEDCSTKAEAANLVYHHFLTREST